MSVTPNLELLAISESQTQKATAINTALSQMEEAISSSYTLNTSLAVTANYNVVIPFDDSNDLSDRQALRMVYLDIAAGATADFNVIHPDNPHLFFAKNSSAHTATVKTSVGSGFPLTPSSSAILYCNGVDVINLSNSFVYSNNIKQAYDFDVAVYNKPKSGQVIAKTIIPRDVIFAANFTGSVGVVGINPTAVNELEVKDNGSVIGTVSVSTAGVVTFTTVSGTEKQVTAGSVLTVQNQSTADATLADLNISLVGTISVPQ